LEEEDAIRLDDGVRVLSSLPDPNMDPTLNKLVSEYMMHKCSDVRCLKFGLDKFTKKCKKGFP